MSTISHMMFEQWKRHDTLEQNGESTLRKEKRFRCEVLKLKNVEYCDKLPTR